MKKQIPLAGLAAIVSAVLLVGGYVWYRSGAGGSVFPGSKRGAVEIGDENAAPPPDQDTASASSTTAPQLLPGWKSSPTELMPSSKVGVLKQPTGVFPGSKSAAVTFDPAPPATQPQPEK